MEFSGLSIGLVIIGHLMQFRFLDYLQAPSVAIFAYPADFIPQLPFNFGHLLGNVGVHLFFIISGFLITSLLLHEERMRGSVNVRAFYTRRIFRILPAFYAYLLAILALALIGVIHVPYADILRSGAFLTDLHQYSPHWFVGHTWSLSVEEQFYILWPALLIVFAKARGWLGLACFVGLLALSAFSPLAGRFSYIAIGPVRDVAAREAGDRCDWRAPLGAAARPRAVRDRLPAARPCRSGQDPRRSRPRASRNPVLRRAHQRRAALPSRQSGVAAAPGAHFVQRLSLAAALVRAGVHMGAIGCSASRFSSSPPPSSHIS